MRSPPAPHYRERLRKALQAEGIDVSELWKRARGDTGAESKIHRLISPATFEDPEKLEQQGYGENAVAQAMEVAERALAEAVNGIRTLAATLPREREEQADEGTSGESMPAA